MMNDDSIPNIQTIIAFLKLNIIYIIINNITYVPKSFGEMMVVLEHTF